MWGHVPGCAWGSARALPGLCRGVPPLPLAGVSPSSPSAAATAVLPSMHGSHLFPVTRAGPSPSGWADGVGRAARSLAHPDGFPACVCAVGLVLFKLLLFHLKDREKRGLPCAGSLPKGWSPGRCQGLGQHVGLPHSWRDPTPGALPCCLSGCVLAGSRCKGRGARRKPGPPTGDADWAVQHVVLPTRTTRPADPEGSLRA